MRSLRLLVCLLPVFALLSAGTCGPTTNTDTDIEPPPGPPAACTAAMCGAVPSVPPRMCEDRSDGTWVVEEVTGCGRDDDGSCGWQVFSCRAADGVVPLACTLPNSCPDGAACLGGFCHAGEQCNEGQDTCAAGSLCCPATNACVRADQYNRCPLPDRVLPR